MTAIPQHDYYQIRRALQPEPAARPLAHIEIGSWCLIKINTDSAAVRLGYGNSAVELTEDELMVAAAVFLEAAEAVLQEPCTRELSESMGGRD